MSVDNYSWDISVWNSATREIKKLQNLEALDGFDPNCTAIGFGGYGFSSKMIGKVVMIWVTPDPIVMVYSQDRNNSYGWKRSSHSLGNFYVNNTGSNLYLKGKYYWICIVQDQNYKEQSHLLWFDFDDETFGKIELPKLDPLAAISAMKDTIALISYCIDGNHIEVWTMNEHNNVITWNHYASVEGNEYSHPMRIWNLGSHLLVFHQLLLGTNDIRELKHFISYDLITKEKKVIYTASWNFYMYPPFVYSEKQSKIMDLNATLKSFDPRSCIDSLESPSDEVNEDEDKKKQANNEKGNEHLKLGKHIFAGEKKYYEKQLAILKSFEEVDSLKIP
nr:putative F-box protein At1g19160 [Ipomoea batatas]